MVKRLGMIILALTIAGPAIAGQQNKVEQKPAATAAKADAPKTPEPPGLGLNVKVEVTITDQSAPGEAAKKTISMIVGDRQNNSIRSSTQVRVAGSYRTIGINLDARPVIDLKDPNKVQLSFGLDYQPKTPAGGDSNEPGLSSLTQRQTLMLESGKLMLVSQAADPTSDRRITVEVTATILR
jgi:hypothetical protein